MTVHSVHEEKFTFSNEFRRIQPPTHTWEQHDGHPAVGWFKRKRAGYNRVEVNR